MTGSGKTKNINIDQYYIYKYNLNYRLTHQEYYRNYCKEYNEKNKTQLQEYRRNYYKNKKLLKKQESIIFFKDEMTTISFN